MQTELLIHARRVAPVDSPGVLEHHAVAVSEGRIVALLPGEEADRTIEARERIELGEHLLIPGLVNAHTHAAMTLFRGCADDLPLEVWLREHIWPAEARWVSAEFVRDGTLAAATEMLAGGTTCFADMYFFPDAAIESALALGLRIASGIVVMGLPTAWAKDPQEYLERGLALHDNYRAHPLVSFMLMPHSPYAVDGTMLAQIASYAAEIGLPVQTHVHETAGEVEESLAKHGVRPLARLAALGLVGPELAAVHMTQVNDEDLELLVRHSVNVVHCPESNLKLASGFCPVAKLLAAGVNVALGTDGAASNNDLDMLGEMHTAALLAKGEAGDPTAFDAPSALKAATLGGARALGLGEEIGSITPGKWADLAAIRLDATRLQPLYDPISQLVYAGGRELVSDVWIAGERRLADGRIAGLDETALRARLHGWHDRIAGEKHA